MKARLAIEDAKLSDAFKHHPGRLHERLHVAEGDTIPADKLRKAAHSKDESLRKEAQAAINMKKAKEHSAASQREVLVHQPNGPQAEQPYKNHPWFKAMGKRRQAEYVNHHPSLMAQPADTSNESHGYNVATRHGRYAAFHELHAKNGPEKYRAAHRALANTHAKAAGLPAIQWDKE